MRVPGPGAAVAAVEDLHEPGAAFHQPARRQALLAEGLRLRLVEAVEGLRRGSFGGEAEDVGDGGLHAEGELVRLDPGTQGGVVGVGHRRERVQPPEQLELALLLLVVDVGPGRGEGERVLRVDGQLDAVVVGAEVVGPVSSASAAAVGDGRAQDDELRQVVVERAQAVVDPRADGREIPLEHVAAGVELELGAVVVVGGPHRADDGDVVDAVAQVGPPVADLDPALAALPEADLHRVDLGMDLCSAGDDSRRFFLRWGESRTSL